MKTLIITLLLLTPNAFAAASAVPAPAAKGLYEALAAVFPDARESFNHSMSVLVEGFSCEAGNEGARCEATTIDGKAVSLEHSVELLNLWDALDDAGIHVKEYQEGPPVTVVHLQQLACDRLMPSDGPESYSCTYKR